MKSLINKDKDKDGYINNTTQIEQIMTNSKDGLINPDQPIKSDGLINPYKPKKDGDIISPDKKRKMINQFNLKNKSNMDELIKFHFAIFDDLLKSEKSNIITDKIENHIDEIKEKLKNTFNRESAHYTSACHYLDKAFGDYIACKKM